MNRRWARALLRLYPATMRRRYGNELLDLQSELRTRGELSRAGLIRDALTGALLARSPRRRGLILGAAMLVAVILVAAGLALRRDRGMAVDRHAPTAMPVAVVGSVVVPHHDGFPYGSACPVGSGACSLSACSVFVDHTSAVASSSSAVLAIALRRAPRRPQRGCTASGAGVRPELIPVAITSSHR